MFVAPVVGMTSKISLACYMVMTEWLQTEMAVIAKDIGSADVLVGRFV